MVATQTCELFSSRKIPIFIAIVQMGCNHQLGKFTFPVEQTPCGLDEDAGKHKSLEIVILLQRMGMLRFTHQCVKTKLKFKSHIWVFPKIGVPPNHPF